MHDLTRQNGLITLVLNWLVLRKTLLEEKSLIVGAYYKCTVGSDIRPFNIQRDLKSIIFEGQISNGPALAMAIAMDAVTNN